MSLRPGSYGRPRTNTRRGRRHRRHSIPESIPVVRGEKCCPWHQRTWRPRRIHRPEIHFRPRTPSEWLLDQASLALSRRTPSCLHQIPTDRDDRLGPGTAGRIGYEELQGCLIEGQRTFDIADRQNIVVEHSSPSPITSASTAFSPLGTAWRASGGLFLPSARTVWTSSLPMKPSIWRR